MAKGVRALDWQKIAFACEVSDEARGKILNKFEGSLIKTEVLQSSYKHPRFAFRLDKKGRVICTTVKHQGEDCLVVLNVDPNHKYETNPALKKGAAEIGLAKIKTSSLKSLETENLEIGVSGAISADGKVVVYTKEQARAISSLESPNPVGNIETIIVNGLPGSGKTTVAQQILSNADREGIEAIYLTKSSRLKQYVSDLFFGRQGQEETLNGDSSSSSSSDSEGSASDSASLDTDSSRSSSPDRMSSVKFLSYNQLAAEEIFANIEGYLTSVLSAPGGEFERFKDALELIKKEEEALSAEAADAASAAGVEASSRAEDHEALVKKLATRLKEHYQHSNALDGKESGIEAIFASCMDTYLQGTLSGIDEFKTWFEQRLKKKGASSPEYIQRYKALDPKEKPSAEEIYIEMQKSQMKLGKKGTLYKAFHAASTEETSSAEGQASIASSILKAYQAHLGESYINPSLLTSPFPDGDDGDDGGDTEEGSNDLVLLIDEAQSLSPLELEFAVRKVRSEYPDKRVKLYLCRDGNQSLSDPFDLTLHLVKDLTGQDISAIYDLNTSFRTPPNITKLSNQLLNIKHHVIGGKLHKIDARAADLGESTEDNFISATDNDGYVDWVDCSQARSGETSTELAEKLAQLKQASQNIIDCAIVAFSKEAQVAASKEFPGSLVLLPDEVVGLEYKKVILYKPFSMGNFSAKDEASFRAKYDASQPVPVNFPSDAENFKFVLPFNELFVAMTRSMNSLHILEGDAVATTRSGKKGARESGKFFKAVFQDVLDSCDTQGGAWNDIGDLSLEALMKHIQDHENLYSPELLAKYIAKAAEMLEAKSQAIKAQISSSEDSSAEVEAKIVSDTKEATQFAQKLKTLLENEGFTDVSSDATQDLHEAMVTVIADMSGMRAGAAPEQESQKAAQAKAATPTPKQQTYQRKKTKGKSKAAHSKVKSKEAQSKGKLKAQEGLSKKDQKLNKHLQKLIKPTQEKKFCEFLVKNPDLNLSDGTKQFVRQEQDAKRFLPLHYAIKQGKTYIIDKLLKLGAKPDIPDTRGNTPMHLAAEYGQVGVIEQLLDLGADVNAKNVFNASPLHKASAYGEVGVIEKLLDRGADIHLKERSGKTSLYMAAEYGHANAIRALEQRGADVNARDNQGLSPLRCAMLQRKDNAAIELLKLGADIDESLLNGFSQKIKVAFFQTLTTSLEPDDLNKAIVENVYELILGPLRGRGTMQEASVQAKFAPALEEYNEKYERALKEFNQTIQEHINSSNPKELCDYIAKNPHLHFTPETTQNFQEKLTEEWMQYALHYCAHKGEIDVIQKLSNLGADVNTKDLKKITPIHVAAKAGNVSAVELLVDIGADVNAKDHQGATPLHVAAAIGKLGVIVELIKLGADIEATDSEGKNFIEVTPDIHGQVMCFKSLSDSLKPDDLNKAIIDKVYGFIVHQDTLLQGDIQHRLDSALEVYNAKHERPLKIFNLVIQGHINSSDSKGLCEHIAKNPHLHFTDETKQKLRSKLKKKGSVFFPLHYAVQEGKVDAIDKLIELGVKVDSLNNRKATALFVAVCNKNVGAIEKLCAHGADANVSIQGLGGSTLLYMAVLDGDIGTIRALLKNGADANVPDNDGATPLHLVAEKGQVAAIQLLLDHKANANIKNQGGDTPLHVAAQYGQVEAIQLLLDRGATIEAVDNSQMTPLHAAVGLGHVEAVKALLDHKANVNARSNTGSTPLHYAISEGDVGIIELLLAHGANARIQDQDGATPYDYAQSAGRGDAADVLQLALSESVATVELAGDGAAPYSDDLYC